MRTNFIAGSVRRQTKYNTTKCKLNQSVTFFWVFEIGSEITTESLFFSVFCFSQRDSDLVQNLNIRYQAHHSVH